MEVFTFAIMAHFQPDFWNTDGGFYSGRAAGDKEQYHKLDVVH